MNDNGFGRLIGVLTSPTKTFTSIAQRPTALVAVLALLLSAILVTAIMTPRMDWPGIIKHQIEDSGREVTPAQLEQQVEIGSKVAKYVTMGSIFVGPIVILLITLIFWVVLKLMGGDLEFKTAYSVTNHAMVPTIVSGLLSLPVLLRKPSIGYEDIKTGSLLMSNPGAFLPEGSSKALLSLLSSLDVFTIWTVVLMVIGYRITAKVSRGTAIGVVVGLWGIYVLGKVGFAAAFSR